MSERTRTVIAAAAAAGLLLLGGCASTLDPCRGDPEVDLRHGDPRCRIDAAILAAESGRLDLVPLLLENLDDPSGEVRLITGIAMRKLTGVDTGFRSYATAGERAAAIERWRRWWQSYEAGRGEHGERVEVGARTER